MLKQDAPLRESEEGDEVNTLARSRTLRVLSRLDGDGKARVVQFLYEAGLIAKDHPVLDLRGGDLSDVSLNDADLSGANLSSVDLRSANLKNADLSDANLSGAELFNASLSHADLSGAQGVTKGTLEADLEAGYIKSLRGAIMPDGQVFKQKFEPTLAFSVNADWQLWRDTTDELLLEGPQGGQLIFTSPSHVFDPSSLSKQTEVPAPENVDEWASWFQTHPNLETPKPAPVSVGGMSGKQIDVTETSLPENNPRDYCGWQSCVPLFPTSDDSGIVSIVQAKDRFVIVDIEGVTVLINVSAPAEKFDEFAPAAQQVLDTVEWQE